VFTIKYRADDIVNRYKACLVAQSVTQVYGMDCLETSPMTHLHSIDVMFFLSINHQWSMFQLNVKNTFVYNDIEEVYMGATS